MSKKNPNSSRCPLCEGDNHCAIAAGESPKSCWCIQTRISKSAIAAAASQSPKRCICPRCGTETHEPLTKFDPTDRALMPHQDTCLYADASSTVFDE